jgi:hypothetical protein
VEESAPEPRLAAPQDEQEQQEVERDHLAITLEDHAHEPTQADQQQDQVCDARRGEGGHRVQAEHPRRAGQRQRVGGEEGVGRVAQQQGVARRERVRRELAHHRRVLPEVAGPDAADGVEEHQGQQQARQQRVTMLRHVVPLRSGGVARAREFPQRFR